MNIVIEWRKKKDFLYNTILSLKKVDNMYVVDLYKKLLLSDLLSIWNTQSACERNENMKKKTLLF